MTELTYLSLLIVVSLPFAGVAAMSGRVWTLAIPMIFWIVVLALQNQGVLPGDTNLGTALFAGIIGAAFAWGGLAVHARITPGNP